MNNGPYKNTLLQHLDSDVIDRLKIRPIRLEMRQALETPGKEIKHLYFVEEGIGSMTAIFKDGSQVEVGMFGYESAVGVSALMGTKRSLNSIYMQLAGHGYTCGVADAIVEFKRGEKFHFLALRYVQAQLTQAMQSAACNATHSHEQRLARWLLICADRAQQNTLAISQEFLSMMLGSTRTTVTLTAGILRDMGLIEYRRGSIHIADQEGLEARACECYCVVKEHLSNFAEFDTGFAV